jgi:hypothetical protein
VVFMQDKCIQCYDSLPDGKEIHTKIINGVLKHLKDEYKAMNDGNEQNHDKWETMVKPSDIP